MRILLGFDFRKYYFNGALALAKDADSLAKAKAPNQTF